MDKRRIVISFIIAVYNGEKYLSNAIESILKQNVEGIEIVIVDDGSTDRSGCIADQYAENNDNISAVHQNNQWIYASFNNGIRNARGEYIYIVNSDDILFDGSIRVLLDKIEEYKHPDVIWTRTVETICDDNQDIIREIHYSSKENIEEEIYAEGIEVHTLWPRLLLAWLSSDSANLYKRTIATEHPFRNDYYTGDQYFNLSIANSLKSCLVIEKPVYRYFIYTYGKGNTAEKYYAYEHQMRTELYREQKNMFKEWGISEDKYKRALKSFRMRSFSGTIRKTMGYTKLSLQDRIKKILIEYMDKELMECVEWTQCRRELESRTLNGIAEKMKCEKLPEDSDMYFVNDLISGLPKNWYEEVDFNTIDIQKIKIAVFNPNNPALIGKYYYGLEGDIL